MLAMLRLKDLKKVHMIGIKGTGMSALALALHSLGIDVSGSDSPDSFLLLDATRFTKAGIPIADDFAPEHVPGQVDAVITSSSHGSKNVEIMEAERRGLPILEYKDVIGLLSREFKSIAVAGSHGKTTTTNLLAHVLQTAGLPVLAIAGPTSPQVLDEMTDAPPLKIRGGRGAIFVMEADEYENKLAHYSPFGMILTNVELDHPDYFKTKAQYEKVFSDFIKKIPADGFLIDGRTIPYELGKHYEFDAELVRRAAKQLGVSDTDIERGIASFRGSPRRMEKVSDHPLIYDDYGHHPTEIKTTLRALKNLHPDKTIWCVFHPHTFTRTKTFLKEFGDSFADADHTIVLEIWGSAREQHGTVSSRDVVAEIQTHGGKADYAATFEDAAALLKGKLNETTVLLTIGAGDIWKLHKLL